MATREALWGYLFISPWVVGLLLFTLGPVLAVFGLSFTHYSILSSPQWASLANYRKILFDDPRVLRSLLNTAYYVGAYLPLQLVLCFTVAILLNTKVRGIAFFRTAYYLPLVVPAIASSLLWGWILDERLGLMRYVLTSLHLPSPPWFASPTWAMPGLILMSLWSYSATTIIIFLAGLQNVPQHLYEAADIDGAAWWDKLRHVTIPMMTPTILYNLIINTIYSFQVFTPAFALTKGGPLDSTLFYVLYIYRHAFEGFRMGYASALAVILFVLIMVFTGLIFRWSNRWVYYEYE